MKRTSFLCIGPEDWHFDSTVSAARRKRLLDAPPFEKIVELLLDEISVEAVQQEQLKSGEPVYRFFAKLRTTAKAIDLFHNSASGYRAQYLGGVELGEAANRFVIDRLLPHVRELAFKRKKAIPPSFVEQSLHHQAAKVWVHQGLWLRRARREHRVLRVPLWQNALVASEKRVRKLARWGCLAPEFESAFVVKGGFVCEAGRPFSGEPVKNRAAELNTCGFT